MLMNLSSICIIVSQRTAVLNRSVSCFLHMTIFSKTVNKISIPSRKSDASSAKVPEHLLWWVLVRLKLFYIFQLRSAHKVMVVSTFKYKKLIANRFDAWNLTTIDGTTKLTH